MNLFKQKLGVLDYHDQPSSPQKIKQGHKNQLTSVYQKLRKNFDREAVKVKLDYMNPAFDDQSISTVKNIGFDNKTVLMRENPPEQPKLQKKIIFPKFYAQKFIINDSIYVHQKKSIVPNQDDSQFRKLSFPKAFNNPSLTERKNKLNKLSKRTLSSINTDRLIQSQKILNSQYIQQSNTKKKRKRIVGQLLKQMEQIKQKEQKMLEQVTRVQSNYMISINTFQGLNSQQIKKKKQDILIAKDSSQLKRAPSDANSQNIQKVHLEKSLTLERNRHNPILKPIAIRTKTFNWKSAQFPLSKTERSQVSKLFQKYLEINEVAVPSMGFYKVYLGEGNNSQLIWKSLKNRGYWTLVENLQDNPNFVWTQLPVKKFMVQQPTRNFKIKNSSFENIENDILAKKHFRSTILRLEILSDQLKTFLKYKNNSFFDSIQKLYEPGVFGSIAKQIMVKFKNGKKINQYNKLWQAITHLIQHKQSQDLKANDVKLHNHIKYAESIGNKKDLFYYMQQYAQIFQENLHQYIPQTLHIPQPATDQQIFKNTKLIEQFLPTGPWIVKPGEATNRGTGITVHTTMKTLLQQVSKKKTHRNGSTQTYIIQRYIYPLLYHGRKFDVRVWVLWTGKQLWWYNQGYLRTSSKQFTLKSMNKYIHLTNDAVQSQSDDFGKYENANKLSFSQFQKYLDNINSCNSNQSTQSLIQKTNKASINQNIFQKFIYPKMKDIAKKVFQVASHLFENNKTSFELFGLDFLIDNNQKVWLIQVNTNPCLEINCSLLARLIPNMIDNLVTIVVDPYFPPPQKKAHKETPWNSQAFKFELLYDMMNDQNAEKVKKKVKKRMREQKYQQY